MTIAAAAVYDTGILLCADTQLETFAIKMHGSKLGHFECPGGRIGYAIAGGASFARSAIQKANKSVRQVKPDKVLETLEKTLALEYRRVVFEHPNHQTDWSLGYSFLIAFWSAETGQASLLVTHDNTLRGVSGGYDCIGSGADLGHYLLAHYDWASPKSESIASLEVAHMLEQVKAYVPGCGGSSQFLAIRNDGSFEVLDPFPLNISVEFSAGLEKLTRQIIRAAADVTVSDEQFERLLEQSRNNASTMRTVWKKLRETPSSN